MVPLNYMNDQSEIPCKNILKKSYLLYLQGLRALVKKRRKSSSGSESETKANNTSTNKSDSESDTSNSDDDVIHIYFSTCIFMNI